MKKFLPVLLVFVFFALKSPTLAQIPKADPAALVGASGATGLNSDKVTTPLISPGLIATASPGSPSLNKEILTKLFTSLSVRFGAAVNRLDRIGKRIGTRLSKLKASGVDTTVLDAKLKAAQDKNLEAKKSLDLIAVSYQNLIASPAGGVSDFSEIKQSLGLVKDELNGVLEAYKLIVGELKSTIAPTKPVVNSLVSPSPLTTQPPVAGASGALGTTGR
ncbi:MAG: hypothetical protein UT63_C0006G0009 [Candidatus Gottesmanbacteria bacterium GW2011_GWC2_39_8]|uniref:DUF5667 domain-containing protein n=1 Tax=Candidatus Gottesmanbacteria bacterium GW2011_GWC2_39_8 TaxID=1618450 RepID=A0A0G0Q9W0_9BACT|nr:MAG: hypothetical protein UT63_C0006G0009 [Candidatus Gottesmanbacteria bacterium GW2011_GWC2_39_8]